MQVSPSFVHVGKCPDCGEQKVIHTKAFCFGSRALFSTKHFWFVLFLLWWHLREDIPLFWAFAYMRAPPPLGQAEDDDFHPGWMAGPPSAAEGGGADHLPQPGRDGSASISHIRF